ncbi:hypothetical protein TYRP_000774 [Tyrophagus putrescentiae]|nr:hypothetical protein TYRP_000774 [Tyrophagus putrescentiae]
MFSNLSLQFNTKDYAVGDLIFSEMPCVKVVAKDAKSEYCDNCLCQSSKTVTLKKCTACMNMHYCSKSCQKEDWFAGHKYECKFYKHHYSDLKDDVPRLFSSPSPSSEEQESTGPLVRSIFSTMNRWKNRLMIWTNCGIGTLIVPRCLSTFRKLLTINCSVFRSTTVSPYGIYSSPSVFSHSCAPNATLSFNGYRLNIRAIKEIHKGDPITFSRTRVDADRKQRHSSLEDILIDCKCERCTTNSDREFDYANMERLEMAMNKAEHIYQQWDNAFQAGKKLTPLYKHLGGYDAIVSFHLMRMVELYKKIPAVELDSDIGDVLEDSVKHVKVTHGVDHPIYKEYLQLLEEYHQEAKGETKKSSGQGAFFRVTPIELEQLDETTYWKLYWKLLLQFK